MPKAPARHTCGNFRNLPKGDPAACQCPVGWDRSKTKGLIATDHASVKRRLMRLKPWCWQCGRRGVPLALDHVIPRAEWHLQKPPWTPARGNRADNYQLLCDDGPRSCHGRKSAEEARRGALRAAERRRGPWSTSGVARTEGIGSVIPER